MQNIVQSVQQVADIMKQISAASSEQSTGIEQVNQAIVSIDDVTQQNAALVEEAAAAAQSMRDQADLLAQAVSVFKLAGSPPPPPAGSRLPGKASLGVVVAAVEPVRRPAAVRVDAVVVQVARRGDLIRIAVGRVVDATVRRQFLPSLTLADRSSTHCGS
jgi:septal ring factor EnvC (AmiA/AmiB activator)